MPTRPRKVFRGAKPPSRLENRFETLWRALGGPELEREFRFHPTRRWRADFAHAGLEKNETQRCRGRRGKRGGISRL